MEKNFLKQYIEFSNAFRKSNGSKESVENIYNLLYELENVNKTKEDNLVLSNVYILLGFHKSAYEVFKETVELSNNKEVSKLYVMEQKAKSHENNFIIKRRWPTLKCHSLLARQFLHSLWSLWAKVNLPCCQI